MDVAVADAYVMACRSAGQGTEYRLAGERTISSVADALMRGPLPVLPLIGALPGLAMVPGGLSAQRGASRVR